MGRQSSCCNTCTWHDETAVVVSIRKIPTLLAPPSQTRDKILVKENHASVVNHLLSGDRAERHVFGDGRGGREAVGEICLDEGI